MKNIILHAVAVGILAVAMGGCLWCATSAEYWYAGEHTEGCNNSDNCGCYEKLLAMDKQTHNKQ